jgi:nitrogen fixation protein FixH
MKTLIIVVSMIAVGATAITIVVGGMSFDGLVVEKPYESGLEWDKTEQQKAALGWRVAIDASFFPLGTNDLRIDVVDRSGARLSDADVSVKLTRPETNSYDRTYTAVRQSDGTYHASVMLPIQGNWQAVIAVAHAKDRTVYVIPLNASGVFHDGHQ